MDHKHEVTQLGPSSIFCQYASCTWKLETAEDIQEMVDELARLKNVEECAKRVVGKRPYYFDWYETLDNMDDDDIFVGDIENLEIALGLRAEK